MHSLHSDQIIMVQNLCLSHQVKTFTCAQDQLPVNVRLKVGISLQQHECLQYLLPMQMQICVFKLPQLGSWCNTYHLSVLIVKIIWEDCELAHLAAP